ncbi:ABC transporter substrate-binding protein [soil metagenome]
MAFKLRQKNARYVYWLFMAFLKKNVQSILLSFLLSLIGIIIIVSLSPYVFRKFSTSTQAIGIAGSFTLETLPPEILSKFSNGLLYANDSGELIPVLSDSWEPVNGGREYRFHIKKDLTWNDGKPFTAKDIKYTFKDVKTEAVNDYLLVFKLTKPLPTFPYFLTKHIVKYPLVGVAGQYRVARIKLKSGTITELHLSPQSQKDNNPIIIYKFYDTDTKLVEAYKLGEITSMSTSKSNVADMFEHWSNTKVEKSVDYSRVLTLFFNLNDPLLKEDKDIRHSIAESIDKTAFNDSGENAIGPIAPISWAYAQDTKKYAYNPSVASKIIKKYTEASGSAEMTISTYYDHLSAADAIKDDLVSAGLNTKVKVLAGNLPSNFQLFLAPMTLPKDPDQYFFWHSTQKNGNITSYKNVRVDKLLEDGRNTFSIRDRKKLYSDFQRVLVEDMPAYFLYYPYVYTIKRI